MLEYMKEDMELKRELLKQQKEEDKEHRETMKVLTSTVDKLSSSISDAFGLMGTFLASFQPRPPVAQWHSAPQPLPQLPGLGPAHIPINSTWVMPQEKKIFKNFPGSQVETYDNEEQHGSALRKVCE